MGHSWLDWSCALPNYWLTFCSGHPFSTRRWSFKRPQIHDSEIASSCSTFAALRKNGTSPSSIGNTYFDRRNCDMPSQGTASIVLSNVRFTPRPCAIRVVQEPDSLHLNGYPRSKIRCISTAGAGRQLGFTEPMRLTEFGDELTVGITMLKLVAKCSRLSQRV